MKLLDFLSKYYNQIAGDTTENTGQCTGLIECWIDELKLPHIWGNAKDLISTCDKTSFDAILNTPDGFPLAGDIICWDSSWGNGFGHTGVCVVADKNCLDVFEQNNPEGAKPHIVHHVDYSGVQGWIRPHYPPEPQPEPVLSDQTKYDFGGDLGTMELGAVRSTITDLKRDHANSAGQVATLTTKLDQSQKTIEDLQNQLKQCQQSLQKPPETPTISGGGQSSGGEILANLLHWIWEKFKKY